MGGYYAFGKELCNGDSVFDFDTTKLSVHTLDIGLAGIEVYDILRDEYDIQIEFGDIGNILAYLSIGDRPQEVERLVSALAEIKRRYQTDGSGLLSQEYIDPVVAASPQEAFYAPKRACRSGRPRAWCAASSSCATRRAFPFWPRVSASPRKF